MGKKGIVLLLVLVWFLNQAPVFFLPSQPIIENQQSDRSERLNEASFPGIAALVSVNKPIIPGFSIDWTLWSNFCSAWPEFLFLTKKVKPYFLGNGSETIPFFDVKQTFIHFFHPW